MCMFISTTTWEVTPSETRSTCRKRSVGHIPFLEKEGNMLARHLFASFLARGLPPAAIAAINDRRRNIAPDNRALRHRREILLQEVRETYCGRQCESMNIGKRHKMSIRPQDTHHLVETLYLQRLREC